MIGLVVLLMAEGTATLGLLLEVRVSLMVLDTVGSSLDDILIWLGASLTVPLGCNLGELCLA